MPPKAASKGKAAPVSSGWDANKYERPGLSAEEVQDVKDAFDLFDVDGSGAISVSEFCEAMKSLGMDKSNKAVFNMVSELDEDGSGEIEFDEF